MLYHFIGIKGSGMASLALILADRKENVQGSDIDKFIFTQESLEARNIPILPFSKENIKEDSVVVIGNSFDDSHIEVQQAKQMRSVKCYRYHEFLGKFMKDYCSISVAGTHGKTTTSGMLAHVMNYNASCGYLIGDGSGYLPPHPKYFVVESCEYKRHFLSYYPDYAIVTNIELDHVDCFPNNEDYISAYQEFITHVKKGLALFGDDPNVRKLQTSISCIYYGLKEENDVVAKSVEYSEKGMSFEVWYKNKCFGKFNLPYVGDTFLWNALAVISIGILNRVPVEEMQRLLSTFQGVKRRFVEERLQETVFIDDYAHHPTAIYHTIHAVKKKYPKKKVVAIFKPDRYSRIAYFLKDFVKSLEEADVSFVCEFPENAVKEENVNLSSMKEILCYSKQLQFLNEDEDGVGKLATYQGCVYLFMSSKDIYKLKDRLKEKIRNVT